MPNLDKTEIDFNNPVIISFPSNTISNLERVFLSPEGKVLLDLSDKSTPGSPPSIPILLALNSSFYKTIFTHIQAAAGKVEPHPVQTPISIEEQIIQTLKNRQSTLDSLNGNNN